MKVYEIDPSNFGKYKDDFKNIIKKPNMCGVFSKSCGHCEMMKPAWNQLKSKVAGTPGLGSLIEIDSQVLPQLGYQPLQNKVSGYPTILIIKEGIPKMEYSGNRSFDDMFSYFNKHMQSVKQPNKLITLNVSSSPLGSPIEITRDEPSEKKTRKRKRRRSRKSQTGGSKKHHRRSKCCKKKNNSKCICKKNCLPQCPCCNPNKQKNTLRKKQKRHRHKHHKHHKY